MTKRLYEIDAYLKEFTATVVSCEQTDGGYQVVLDQTAFFPEGGGQAADEGTLDEVAVLDVQIKEDVIYHKTEAPLPKGATITGQINWPLRFSRMQNHAAEHLVSGIVHSQFGYNNIGFHMSESFMTADFDGVLSPEQVAAVEDIANDAIYQNVPIKVWMPTPEELKAIDYRSKIDLDSGVRLVEIQGYDCCACCAPHPATSGEIGVIKILNYYPNKGGTRVEMIAGKDAFADYCNLHNQNKTLMGLLSAKRELVSDSVQKLSESLKTAQNENRQLQQKLTLLELEPIKIDTILCGFAKDTGYDSLQYCVNQLAGQGQSITALFAGTESHDYLYVVASETEDVRPVIKGLNETFGGRGGGKPNYGQGKLTAPDKQAIVRWLQEYK